MPQINANANFKKMFVIIKDLHFNFSAAPENYEVLEIKGINDYIKARQKIEKVKELKGKPLAIVIRSKDFLNSFRDIETIAKVLEYSSRNRLEDTLRQVIGDVMIPLDLDNETIYQLRILEHKSILIKFAEVLFKKKYDDKRELIRDIVLATVIGSDILCLPSLTNDDYAFKELFRYFSHFDFTELYERLKTDFFSGLVVKRLDELKQRVKSSSAKSFVAEFTKALKEEKVESLIEQIIVRFLLRGYHSNVRKNILNNLISKVGPIAELKEDWKLFDLLHEGLSELYQETIIDEDVNTIIADIFDEIDELNVSDISEYLENCSGYFKQELEQFVSRFSEYLVNAYFAESFDRQHAFIILNKSRAKFEALLKKESSTKEKISAIVDLIEFIDKINFIKERDPRKFDDITEAFKRWYDLYELYILRCDELQFKLKGYSNVWIKDDVLAKISNEYKSLNQKKSTEYEGWLFRSFPKFLLMPRNKRPLVMDVVGTIGELLGNGYKVIFLVVDALRWDTWEVLKEVFQNKGYLVKEEKKLSMIPSSTKISRSSLFGGASYLDLVKMKHDSKVQPDDEPRTLARALSFDFYNLKEEEEDTKKMAYLSHELAYIVGGYSDFNWALSKDAKVYALVSSDMDGILHSIKVSEETLRRSVRPVFEELVKNLLDSIKNIGNVKIVIATDHGFLSIDKTTEKIFDLLPNMGIEIDKRERWATLTLYDRVLSPRNINFELLSKDWHVIPRNDTSAYGLPRTWKTKSADKAKSQYLPMLALVLCKGAKYLHKGKGNYVHGGLSFYETIIPFAVLTSAKIEIKNPSIVIEGKYEKDKESTMKIILSNLNDIDLKKVKVTIENLGIYEWPVERVAAKDKCISEIPFTPRESCDQFQVLIKVNYEAQGKDFEVSEPRIIKIEKSRAERLQVRRDAFDEI